MTGATVTFGPSEADQSTSHMRPLWAMLTRDSGSGSYKPHQNFDPYSSCWRFNPMADEPDNNEAEESSEEQAESKGGSPLPFIIVGILGTMLGLAVPFLMPSAEAPADDAPDIAEKNAYVGDNVKKAHVDFEEDPTVQNLKGNTMSRYLSVSLSLVVADESKDQVALDLEDKRVEMKNWLIGQIADKTLEDVAGKAGQNRLRREIRDQFNSILFPDGHDRIFDIYFSSFAVQ